MTANLQLSEIKLARDRKTLFVTFGENKSVGLAAEFLRVESPSAEVQGHGAGQKKTPSGKRNVTIAGIEQVGNYAVKLLFDDGHSTGIFSWALLQDYAVRQETLMSDYIARLAERGLTRD